MIITEKDLGLIIINSKPSPSILDEDLDSLFYFEMNDRQYHLAFKKNDSYIQWEYATSNVIKEFSDLFVYKTWTEIDNSSSSKIYYSDIYDILFEGDESSLMYWQMKYLNR